MTLKSITLRSIVVLFLFSTLTSAQEKPRENSQVQPPRIDLLKLESSKPNLKPDGEGLTSYKIQYLFKSGVTRVKPYDSNTAIELPTGYTLFNNLAYVVDTDAVYSGPNQIVFRVPSALNAESFNQLRILYADDDPAQPEKPRWVDITVTPEVPEEVLRSNFSKTALLPDFATRTLNATTEKAVRFLVVASRDEKLARDNFTVDLQLKATVSTDSVMEGREINYSFEITNHGPETATAISFTSQIDPEFVSLGQSQGKCRFEAQNIYCNLGELKKGATASITYHGRCRWDFIIDGQPIQSNGMSSNSWVQAAEMDSNFRNNEAYLSTPVKEDPNRKPVISIVKPAGETFLVGPKVNLKIVANAYDPDGTISEVEFFDETGSLGLGKLTAPKTYEIDYQTEKYGSHFLRALATDNQGRPALTPYATFIVNGPVQIRITDPKPDFLLDPPRDDFVVKLRAVNPKGTIKNIVVYISEGSGSRLKQAAQLVGKDEYVATFKSLGWECTLGPCHVWAVATDDLDVATTSSVTSFRVARRE